MNATRWNPTPLVLAALVLAGCADLKPQLAFRSADYQHYEDAVRAEFYWNCSRPDARTVAIQGVATYKTSAATRIYYPTFTLLGRDRAGKVVSKATGATRIPVIGLADYAPWQVVLPLQGSEVRFDLEYEYQWQDYGGGDGNRTGRRSGLSRPGVIPASLNFFNSKIPDACGERAAGRPIRGTNSFGTHSY